MWSCSPARPGVSWTPAWQGGARRQGGAADTAGQSAECAADAGSPADSGLEVLAVQRVSKTQAWQRTGRAGREDSGICYRLYTEAEFEKFDKMTVPEIQR